MMRPVRSSSLSQPAGEASLHSPAIIASITITSGRETRNKVYNSIILQVNASMCNILALVFDVPWSEYRYIFEQISNKK